MDSQKIYDDFISKYPIYQDNRVFKLLISKFKDVFVKDVYDDIPKIFKQLYENNEIPSDVYDYFLIDIGVSEDLIKELSDPEKLIFIKSLSDFQKYKSTIGLVRNVVQAYGDSIEVYELYIDYDKIHSVWECKPYLIYKPAFSTESYSKAISYKIVYEKIPSLLIHEKQLDQMRLSNIGIFPIKTNIVFLNSNYNQSITSYLQNLITTVFCNTYSDEVIDLYFIDQLIPCTLYQFILLWLQAISQILSLTIAETFPTKTPAFGSMNQRDNSPLNLSGTFSRMKTTIIFPFHRLAHFQRMRPPAFHPT